MADVYGTYSVLETAKDKLKAYADALVTAMATGYDPKLSYAYEGHIQALLRTNAISIALDSYTREEIGTLKFQYLMTFSVRVHTNYEGRYIDNIQILRLLNSVDNYLSTHLDMSDGYYIVEISDGHVGSFDDSGTVGGELFITIRKEIDHTQS